MIHPTTNQPRCHILLACLIGVTRFGLGEGCFGQEKDFNAYPDHVTKYLQGIYDEKHQSLAFRVDPKFQVGDKVRVKQGVFDAEYPDLPIGGWAGRISEVHDDGLYTVEWSEETLAGIPPVYKARCERDGLEIERYWLRPDDLIPDPGGPLEIQQPTNIVTKPLNLEDEEDRIRAVFQLTSDDPLPEGDFETLEVYRDYLAEHLTFPFEAALETESGPFSSRREKVMVTGLGDPKDDGRIDDTYGLICEIKIGKQCGDAPLAELEVQEGDPNRQLVQDYCLWFCNYR